MMILSCLVLAALLCSPIEGQVTHSAVTTRADAVKQFFVSQQLRLAAFAVVAAAHKGQLKFNLCLRGKMQMGTTAEDPKQNKTTIKIGWATTQLIGISKRVGEFIQEDGAGEPTGGGGSAPGGAGDDPKYMADAFLGSFFHELKHTQQKGDGANKATNDANECEAHLCEILFYQAILDEDPCYSVMGSSSANAERRAQLTNRRDNTRDEANDLYGCDL